jgi:hypothetical protein
VRPSRQHPHGQRGTGADVSDCSGGQQPRDPGGRAILRDRGVLCLPDVVTNCGGVLGGTMAFACITAHEIATFIERASTPRFGWIQQEAATRDISLRRFAEELALLRLEETRQGVEQASIGGRLFGLGLELHRRGWIPGRAVGALSPGYFERRLPRMTELGRRASDSARIMDPYRSSLAPFRSSPKIRVPSR